MDTAKFAALQSELAKIELVDEDTISIAYFKTSDAETQALLQYQDSTYAQFMAGKAPAYCVNFPSSNCSGYTFRGLRAAGIHISIPAGTYSLFPNNLFDLLVNQSDADYSSSNGERMHSMVTSTVCPNGHIDPGGNFVCQ